MNYQRNKEKKYIKLFTSPDWKEWPGTSMMSENKNHTEIQLQEQSIKKQFQSL